MVQSVLSSLTLGYRPLWNQARRLAGVQLYLHEEPGVQADVAHLLRILRETWSTQSPPVLLSPQSRQVLCDLLENASKGSPWIEVRGDWLQDSAIYDLVRQAHARGLMLVWRGPLSDVPDAQAAHWFASSLLHLPPEGASGMQNQTALALQQAAQAAHAPAKLQALKQAARPAPTLPPLQLLGGQMYEGLDSLALTDLCLDSFHAGAIAGWPVADTLHAQRHHAALPSRDTVLALMRAVDAEQSIEAFEQILGEDPILAYRFMLYTNSAALGLRGNVGQPALQRAVSKHHQAAAQRVHIAPQAQGCGVGVEHEAIGQDGVLAQDLLEGLDRLLGIDGAHQCEHGVAAGQGGVMALGMQRIGHGPAGDGARMEAVQAQVGQGQAVQTLVHLAAQQRSEE